MYWRNKQEGSGLRVGPHQPPSQRRSLLRAPPSCAVFSLCISFPPAPQTPGLNAAYVKPQEASVEWLSELCPVLSIKGTGKKSPPQEMEGGSDIIHSKRSVNICGLNDQLVPKA